MSPGFLVMEDTISRLEALWSELVEFGYEPSRVELGIWEGARTHQIQFVAGDKVIESVPVFLSTIIEFEALRAWSRALHAVRRRTACPQEEQFS